QIEAADAPHREPEVVRVQRDHHPRAGRCADTDARPIVAPLQLAADGRRVLYKRTHRVLGLFRQRRQVGLWLDRRLLTTILLARDPRAETRLDHDPWNERLDLTSEVADF